MGRILFLLTVLLAIQIYALLFYEYGETYGFDDQINPITIIAGVLAIIGVIALFGRILNNKDTKRGYCESGITQEQIDTYRSNHRNDQKVSKCDSTQHTQQEDSSL